jgi:predicted amidohydrolase YtcJ
VILHNGSVRTGDARLPLVHALAIAGEVIGGGVDVREGDRSRVSNERVDLDGRCVVPGFTDAHVHFLEWSLSLARRRCALA